MKLNKIGYLSKLIASVRNMLTQNRPLGDARKEEEEEKGGPAEALEEHTLHDK